MMKTLIMGIFLSHLLDDGGIIEEAAFGVVWKRFEEQIVRDYLRDIE